MYDPVRVPRRLTRRGVRVTLVMLAVMLIAIVVVVVRTMPHPPPSDPLTLEQIEMVIPDEAQTQLIAATVRTRIGQPHAGSNAPAAGSACTAPKTPHTWSSAQRQNATTIVQVGLALNFPKRGEIVALAAAMQESHLTNLGYLGDTNNLDSLGLFQQRPSMGWGTEAEVTDPVYSSTAFYLALRSVRGWQSMSVTGAAQSVQRSGFPNAYAQWETDATALTEQILCTAL